MLPIERDHQRRARVKIVESKPGADDKLEAVRTHELSRKYDIREYFDAATKVDRQQLFVAFPENEREEVIDANAAWRRRKKQKMVEDLMGAETHEDQAAPAFLIGIGKLPENEITCLHPSVSRTHVAIMPFQGGKVALIDLGSSGGTLL